MAKRSDLETFLTLDFKGLFTAIIFGFAILILGANKGIFFLLVILLFLVISAIVTEMGKGRKVVLKTYERSRGWKNVVANGIVPVFAVFLYFLNSHLAFLPQGALVVGYVASVAAVSADKFASEIGVLDKHSVMLLTFKKIKPGVSGGVSIVGFVSAAFACLIIGLSLLNMSNFTWLLIIIIISGSFGNVIDSVFGYFENKGIGNKYFSNIMCGLGGLFLGVLLYLRLY